MYKHKRIYQIDRRSFLKGLGGAAISLPLFDFFLNESGTAYAQGAPLPMRYLLMMHGLSPASDLDSNAATYVRDFNNRLVNYLVPNGYGSAYTPVRGLLPLNNFPNLKPYVSVFSNLDLPFNLSGAPPAGGYVGGVHDVASYALLTGRKSHGNNVNDPINLRDRGPSSDQIMRNLLSSTDRTRLAHLNMCAEHSARIFVPRRTTSQYLNNGDPTPPMLLAKNVFDSLFRSFVPPSTTVNPAEALELDKRKSVLDMLDKDRMAFLNRQLASREKAMLVTHLDFIRDIELRVQAMSATPVTAACLKPADPGSAVPVIDRNADLMVDLTAMAIICDLARQGTFRTCSDQSFMASDFITGTGIDFHELTHGFGPADNVIKCVQWSVSKFLKLADTLRKVQEGSGNILDRSAIVFTTESGNGRWSDPGANPIRPEGVHSGDNMAVIVAGKAGGIKAGIHENCQKAHPSRVLLSVMRAQGYSGALGDINSTLSQVIG